MMFSSHPAHLCQGATITGVRDESMDGGELWWPPTWIDCLLNWSLVLTSCDNIILSLSRDEGIRRPSFFCAECHQISQLSDLMAYDSQAKT